MAANASPAVSTAGHTSSMRFQPASTTTRNAGMISASTGTWRPTIAENRSVAWSGLRCMIGAVSRPSTISGLPSPPNATGAVFASSASTTAFTGGKPSAAIIAAVIAIGDPPPATPSSSAPKPNAMSSACSRRSSLNPARTRLMRRTGRSRP